MEEDTWCGSRETGCTGNVETENGYDFCVGEKRDKLRKDSIIVECVFAACVP